MARKKSSSSQSASKQGGGSKQARGTSSKSQGASAARGDSSGSTLGKARGFVEANASFQTAGIALASAGILALVSTEAGRSLLRTASDAVISMISSNSESVADAPKNSRTRGDQARV